ncbi:condensation domain-containing protein [Dactylosporangium sp. CA-233914]|uniref:condensation domain-containing protein n=1 Tax=Dactylosporangium sp. CA-233914 TaxID=3239934 RepID=UPI003D8F2BEF
MATPARVVIPFEGEGAGRGPLSWGQIESWQAVQRLGHWMPIGGVRPVPAGTTLTDLVGELRFTVQRHVTLRTRLHVPDDGGTPEQEVFAAGELVVEVYENVDPEAIADGYRVRPLNFATEWPIRAAVVCHDGVPAFLVALISHFAMDAAGAATMLREVAERPQEPPAGLTPLQQAAWQASPSGRRQNASAQRHFEAILRTMPPQRFATPVVPRSPRYWRARFDSAALPLALRAITDRLEVDPAVTLLAVYAAALHETFGLNPVVIRPLVSNRFRAGLSDMVCTAVQAGLCGVDCEAGFDEIVERTRKAALAGFKYGYFDQRDLWALRDRVAAERGEPLEIGCFLNDRRGPVPMDRPSAEQIEAALPESRLSWITRQDHPALEPLILDVEDLPEVPGAVRCTAHTDTALLAPRDAERVLWNMEHLAVSFAHPAHSSLG